MELNEFWHDNSSKPNSTNMIVIIIIEYKEILVGKIKI